MKDTIITQMIVARDKFFTTLSMDSVDNKGCINLATIEDCWRENFDILLGDEYDI